MSTEYSCPIDDNSLASASSTSIELSSSDENGTNSYVAALKGSPESDTFDSNTNKKIISQPKATSSANPGSAPQPSTIPDDRCNQDDYILVLKAGIEGANLNKVEEKVKDMFKNVPTNLIRNSVKGKKIVIFFPTEKEKENIDGKFHIFTFFIEFFR